VLICNLSSLLPLAFIGCIPDEDPLAEVAHPPPFPWVSDRRETMCVRECTFSDNRHKKATRRHKMSLVLCMGS
jgi:hypothetical protein